MAKNKRVSGVIYIYMIQCWVAPPNPWYPPHPRGVGGGGGAGGGSSSSKNNSRTNSTSST